jgi:hypothetical protein
MPVPGGCVNTRPRRSGVSLAEISGRREVDEIAERGRMIGKA